VNTKNKTPAIFRCLLFNVFSEYDPHNLLLRQAYFIEVMEQANGGGGFVICWKGSQKVRSYPVSGKLLHPFCFPLKVDSMREDLLNQKN
jgi:ATP-dependent Lhr-like helicase